MNRTIIRSLCYFCAVSNGDILQLFNWYSECSCGGSSPLLLQDHLPAWKLKPWDHERHKTPSCRKKLCSMNRTLLFLVPMLSRSLPWNMNLKIELASSEPKVPKIFLTSYATQRISRYRWRPFRKITNAAKVWPRQHWQCCWDLRGPDTPLNRLIMLTMWVLTNLLQGLFQPHPLCNRYSFS